MRALIEQQQRDTPWAPGFTLLGLSKRLRLSEEEVANALVAFVESGRLAYRGGYYMLPGSGPMLTEPQRAFFEAAVPMDPQRPHFPVSYERVATEMRFARIAGLHHAFEFLLATGALIQVGGDLYRAEQVRAIQGLLEAMLRDENGITPAQFRDLIGTSRKYALPLLEWFDAANVTIRSGDVRVLANSASLSE